MCLSKHINVDAILVGLEKTACLIDRCAIYESLCTDDSAASANLEKSILRLYTAILKFLAKSIKISNGKYSAFHRNHPSPSVNSSRADSFSDNLYKPVFGGAISNYLDEVEQLEKTVGQDASVAEAQCIIQPHHENSRNVDSM